MLDSLLFCQDKLHLIQKGNIKLSESVIKATEDSDIGQNIFFNETTNKKHKQFMKTCKMAVSFTTASRSFSNKVSALPFKSLTKASNKPFPSTTRFCPGNFAPKHLHNPLQLLVFDLACNVPTRLKHVICKSVAPFEAAAVNVNFAPVYVCQRVNVVKLVFCHPHISFLANPCLPLLTLFVLWLFTKSVNSAHHIRRVFPSVHCTASIHRQFSYQRNVSVTSFPLRSSNLLSSSVIKCHLSPLTSTLNLSPRHPSPPGASSSPNFQHVPSSIKICLFLMTLFNAILLNQPTQYILVFNILTDIF